MTRISTGYEGPGEEKPVPPPDEREWSVEVMQVGETLRHQYVRILLDKEAIGMIRLPDSTYIRWLREKLK